MIRMIRCVWIGVACLSAREAAAQATILVSRGAGGPGDDVSDYPALSADGRYVAFESKSHFLVNPSDNGNFWDVFVRDRQAATTEVLSVDGSGNLGNSSSRHPSISADGRFVAFESFATNLVAGDTNGTWDIFVRDRSAGTIERVSVSSAGLQADAFSLFASLSVDGRFVVFQSGATNLAPGGSNGAVQIFLRDRLNGTTEVVSKSSSGVLGNAGSVLASVSADGRFVVFSSTSSNLVPGDTNGLGDVFVRDLQNGTTARASLDSSGGEAAGDSGDGRISANGRFVAFQSGAANLVPVDLNGTEDVFVKDLQTGATELISLSSGGVQGDGTCQAPALSPDGRFVVFTFFGTNLVPGDTNGVGDAFLRDRQNGTTERVSLGSGGGQANGTAWEPRVSDDGRFVAFADNATNLVPYDLNGTTDVFLRDRQLVLPAFTSLCDPGVGAVIACPCSNPPAGSGQGCDHSGATGGASLSATGNTQVSADGLVFTTSGERASALSILVQGNAVLPAGLVYGQGVRCVGGTLRRLYTKSASGGAILAPDLDAGDPPVTVRSAQKGDFISGGQSRWYMVYYRDPSVLGGCPATSTFNSTQTGEIAWAP